MLKLKRLLLFVLIFSTVISCGKKNELSTQLKDQELSSVSQSNSSSQSLTSDPWEEAQNENNPYDTLGYHHNMSVDYILNSIPSEPTNNDVYIASGDYVESVWGPGAREAANEEFTLNKLNDFMGSYSDNSYNVYSLIENSQNGQDVKDALKTLVDILRDSTNYADTSYSFIKGKIIEWEDNILKSTDFSAAELKQLLSTGSVARYSS